MNAIAIMIMDIDIDFYLLMVICKTKRKLQALASTVPMTVLFCFELEKRIFLFFFTVFDEFEFDSIHLLL